MSSIINRRPTGTPAGGQFAPKQHGEPALALAQTFDSAFEADRGQDTLRTLQALPASPLRGAAAASKYSDLLRDSYGSYFADGEAEVDATPPWRACGRHVRYSHRVCRAHRNEALRQT